MNYDANCIVICGSTENIGHAFILFKHNYHTAYSLIVTHSS